MSEIPEDIHKAAFSIAGSVEGTSHPRVRSVDAIARAILAERQRCADIAEGFRQAHDTGSGFDSQPARATAEAIKDIILNPH